MEARLNYDKCKRGLNSQASLPEYCAEYLKYYQPGSITEDESDLLKKPDDTPPDEEYEEALRRYEDHLRRADEALTGFDALYWIRRMDDCLTFFHKWYPLVRRKFFVLGKEVVACLVAGAIFLTFWGIILSFFGPLKVQTVGVTVISFLIALTFINGSIEIAASCLIGCTFIGYIFMTRIAIRNRVEYIRDTTEPDIVDHGGGDADGQYSVVFRIQYWYIVRHSVWINLSKGLIGMD